MKHEHTYIAVLSIVLIVVIVILFTTKANFTQSIERLEGTIESNAVELQEQLIQDLQSIQETLDRKIDVVEGVQLKTLDQIDLLKRQLDTEGIERTNELDRLRNELASVQAYTSNDITLLAEKVIPSVVSIRTNLGSGSGVFIASEGEIITNKHVISGVTSAVVVTHDGKTHRVTLIGSHPTEDIAVVKIDSDKYPHLLWADSDKIKVGQKVVAIGNPRGLDFSVTEGIVSALRRIDGRDVIQTDVPINPGNSGGPLINLDGLIVGINTFKVADSEGLGFAIPSNRAAEAESTIQKG